MSDSASVRSRPLASRYLPLHHSSSYLPTLSSLAIDSVQHNTRTQALRSVRYQQWNLFSSEVETVIPAERNANTSHFRQAVLSITTNRSDFYIRTERKRSYESLDFMYVYMGVFVLHNHIEINFLWRICRHEVPMKLAFSFCVNTM
jgi:hypothetical protein